jgi:hypothetical protein
MNSSSPEENNPDVKPAWLDDHLQEADLFSIYGLNGENIYKIAKIVMIRGETVHIFVYDKGFSERPNATAIDGTVELPSWLTAQQSRDMYYPVSRKLFSLMRPVFLGNRPVVDAELNGYRQWCLTGAGHVLGSQISLDDEIEHDFRVYTKIFMTFFTPTFIAFTFYMLAYGVVAWIPYAFLFGVIFGTIMVVLQWASITRQQKDTLRRVSASSIQFHEIEMPVDFASAFEHGVRALGAIENCKPVAVDTRGGTIEARVRKSLVDDGQEILMVFSRTSAPEASRSRAPDQVGTHPGTPAHRTTCIVWSESSKKGVTVDMGKNLGNVNAIISYLKSSTQSKQPFSAHVGDNMATEPDKHDA